MCDVCETSLFNVHWVCSKCGFAVCMDCYRTRQEGTVRAGVEPGRDRDRFHRVHDARRRAGLALVCQCESARRPEPVRGRPNCPTERRHKLDEYDGGDQDDDKKGSPLTLLANVALYDSKKNSDVSNSESETEGGDKEVDLSTLRNLLLRTTEGGQLQEKPNSKNRQYPDVRHGWLCDGRLLRLTEPDAAGALRLFRDQWRRGQPVLCSGVSSRLDATIWTPDSFSREFGEEQSETVGLHERLRHRQRSRSAASGTASRTGRSVRATTPASRACCGSATGRPGEEFADVMPARYNDLMTALPVTEYTRRDGRHNLVGCVPECFVRPDLGPRLHAAYGSAASAAATCLRQDVSDSVNVLAYVVGAEASGEDEAEVQRAVEEAGCDPLTKRRVKEERAGVIWHIYHAADADKIRDLLNKVSVERGEEADREHDPLLEPTWYLDGPLRRRLHAGVRSLRLRHLRSCISASVEFVSPENVGVSFELTQQLRAAAVAAAAAEGAGAQTAGHDDKRQIKNIIYHAMKEAVSCLLRGGGGGGGGSPPAGAS
ncbi:Lysine-specific demethylase 3A [Amphibalanus amphitrite]|uniref:Lysine-specific demethylase 3A n=1 Tax=Amphibalanus amphitrite TaxID=1232801 RepID=A0A6A4WU83_AMPAM|nr:Lysine-specific demethylase 3A [Amphibalanus amphitrite]